MVYTKVPSELDLKPAFSRSRFALNNTRLQDDSISDRASGRLYPAVFLPETDVAETKAQSGSTARRENRAIPMQHLALACVRSAVLTIACRAAAAPARLVHQYINS